MQRRLQVQTSQEMMAKANRRRSLKTLFQIPISTRSSIYPFISTTHAVGPIPADIILEIMDFLTPVEVLNVSLTCSELRTLLVPTLYHTVVLKSSRKCQMALKMLTRRPDICRYITKLAVRPNYYLSWPKPDEFLDEAWLSEQIESIAGGFVLLHTFDWDGLELPKDSLWEKLRLGCPLLKHIYTNVGSLPFTPDCPLFDFTNLTTISLVVRHGLGGSELFPPLEELPERFWQMIIKHCPDLEELSICSFSSSSRVFDFERVTEGSWPKLHTLTLGSFGYQSDFTLGPPNDVSLGQFLDAHTSLEYIRFLWNFKRWMSPEIIPMPALSSNALPQLQTFIGVYQQLAELPNPESIEKLDLTCEPIYEGRVEPLCAILKKLTNLTSFDIWTHVFDPSRDHSEFFHSILSSCPKLTDFHFMCTTSFTVVRLPRFLSPITLSKSLQKPMKQLISQLRLLPDLKRFSLTKGHQYIDEEMLDTALRVIKHNPGLTQINIRWARERCPNHLKQDGTYDVIVDKDGTPEALMVVERGIHLVGLPFERRFKYNLAPKSIVGRVARIQETIDRRSRRMVLRAFNR